jgi:type IV pilus assembly protein PilX
MKLQTMRPQTQKGAALIVSLILMLVLTVLGISAMNMSTLELQMAGNNQASQLAFQAAETGIDRAMAGNVTTVSPTTYNNVALGDGTYSFTAQIACAATTVVPEGIYSEDGGARAIHFDATATGQGPRNAVSFHRNSVYIVGPAPGNPNFNPAVSPGSC